MFSYIAIYTIDFFKTCSIAVLHFFFSVLEWTMHSTTPKQQGVMIIRAYIFVHLSLLAKNVEILAHPYI